MTTLLKNLISKIRLSKFQKILLIVEILGFFLLFFFTNRALHEMIILGNDFRILDEDSMISNVSITEEGLVISTDLQTEEIQEECVSEVPLNFSGGGGAYHVVIDYKNLTAVNPEVSQSQCYIEIESDKDQDKILSNSQMLYDNAIESEGVFWISPFAGSIDAKLKLYVKDPGTTVIQNIRIEESLKYRYYLLLLYVAICSFVWFAFYLCSHLSENQKVVLLLLFFIVFYNSIPLFSRGYYDTRDMLFHLKRIGSLAEGLSRGNFPVRYEPDVANGFGYVEHIFYPNLFLYFPAILFLLDVPLYFCYKIYIFIINIATCVISYFSFKRIFHSKIIGILGTGIYSLAIYRIFNLYGLNAAGELSAKIFFPLLCYGLWDVINQKKPVRLSDCWPLIISGIGIICSHVLTWELLLIFLALFFLMNWREYIRRDIIWAFCQSCFIILGCCAFFLIPFFDGLSMSMGVNHYSEDVSIGEYALDVSTLFRFVFEDKDSARSVGNVFLIGLILFGICIIYQRAWKLKSSKEYAVMRKLALLGIISIWMCTELFPWNYISYISKRLSWFLGVVQFPWRYLSITGIIMTLVTCYSVKTLSIHLAEKFSIRIKNALMAGFSISLVVISILEASNYMGHYVLQTDIVNWAYMNNDVNYALALRDYVPEDVHSGDFCTNEVICSSDDISIKEYYSEGDKKYCVIKNAGTDGYVDLPVFCYKQMQITNKNIGENMQITKGTKGRLRVMIPKGFSGTLEIIFKIPIAWRIGEGISLVFWIILGIIRCIHKRKDKEVKGWNSHLSRCW